MPGIMRDRLGREFGRDFAEEVDREFESWPRKFGRSGRWSFCLMTGTLCPSNQERS